MELAFLGFLLIVCCVGHRKALKNEGNFRRGPRTTMRLLSLRLPFE